MLIRGFVSAAAMCAFGAAIAQEAGPPQAAAPVKERKICRAIIATGSVMTRRKCLTKAEWARLDSENAAQAENFRDRRDQAGGMRTTQ